MCRPGTVGLLRAPAALAEEQLVHFGGVGGPDDVGSPAGVGAKAPMTWALTHDVPIGAETYARISQRLEATAPVRIWVQRGRAITPRSR